MTATYTSDMETIAEIEGQLSLPFPASTVMYRYEVVITADGPRVITKFPSDELFVANAY